MAKVVLVEENWVTKPNENYEYAFKANVEIVVDIPDVTITDEQYSKLRKAISSIKSTLGDARRIADRSLEDHNKKEEKK